MRGRMTMRTDVLRNQTSSDPWGGDGAPNFQAHLQGVSCRGYVASTGSAAGRVALDEDRTVAIEDRRVAVPLDADVQVGDMLDDVVDRQAKVLFDGPMQVDAVLRRVTHLELTVKRTSWPDGS